ncbi:hypothetical protein GCM10009548_51520 [Streptomyces malaysiensis subsp. malaysiensis]
MEKRAKETDGTRRRHGVRDRPRGMRVAGADGGAEPRRWTGPLDRSGPMDQSRDGPERDAMTARTGEGPVNRGWS